MRPTYDVQAERDGKWWVLHTEGVPGAFTQVRRLADAEEWIREAISMVLDVPEDSFDVVVKPNFPPELMKAVAAAEAAARSLAIAREQSAKTAAIAAAELVDHYGLPLRDAGTVLNVSFQRVDQLRNEAVHRFGYTPSTTAPPRRKRSKASTS